MNISPNAIVRKNNVQSYEYKNNSGGGSSMGNPVRNLYHQYKQASSNLIQNSAKSIVHNKYNSLSPEGKNKSYNHIQSVQYGGLPQSQSSANQNLQVSKGSGGNKSVLIMGNLKAQREMSNSGRRSGNGLPSEESSFIPSIPNVSGINSNKNNPHLQKITKLNKLNQYSTLKKIKEMNKANASKSKGNSLRNEGRKVVFSKEGNSFIKQKISD